MLQELVNLRVVFRKQAGTDNTPEVLSESHYYPFGLELNGQHYNLSGTMNEFKYNGKEQQEQTWNYDYGFRQLDPQLCRWHSPDLLAEQFYSESPYSYAGNNPVSNIDLYGLASSDGLINPGFNDAVWGMITAGWNAFMESGEDAKTYSGAELMGMAASSASPGGARTAFSFQRYFLNRSLGRTIRVSFWNAFLPVSPGSNLYLLYDGNNSDIGTMYVFGDNNTPDNYSDDSLLSLFEGKNDAVGNGKWEDGVYPMLDTSAPHTHGNSTDRNGILLDSNNGSFGSGGIFRAVDYNETYGGNRRTGMGIHAGRENQNWQTGRKTEGCVRVKPEGFDDIVNAIDIYGDLTRIIVKNNRVSADSYKTHLIVPEVKYEVYLPVNPIQLLLEFLWNINN